MIHKKDYRRVKQPKTAPHLCWVWFHWSWRPRLQLHYWDSDRGMIYVGIFRNDNNNHIGVNGCKT